MRWFLGLLVACGGSPTETTGFGTLPPTDTGTPTVPDDTGTTPDDTDTDATDTDTTPTAFDGQPGTFTDTFQGRGYHLYVPPQYDPADAWPLVVGFHGAGDSGSNFFAFTQGSGLQSAADQQGFLHLVPDTRSPYSDFANWSGDPNDDLDEMGDELDDVLTLVADIATTWHVDDQQLHLYGFSNGGLFTAAAGLPRADQLGTLTIFGYGWGGFALGTPARTIPVQFGCGTQDFFAGYATDSESYLAGAGHDTRIELVGGVGHSLGGILGDVPATDWTSWMLARPL